MNRNILSYRRCWILILLVLLSCAPVSAQYRDNLGGNWNNPASAMIPNIVMDRMARRRLKKRLAEKRLNAGLTTGSQSSEASRTACKLFFDNCHST